MLGIKKDALARLRKRGCPYVELSRTQRVYLADDVFEWIKTLTVSKTSTENQKQSVDTP